jgi:CRP-like cAMP-binding protein
MSPDAARVIERLRRVSPIGPQAAAKVAARFVPFHFEAGAWLLSAGDRATRTFFVLEGLVRELYSSADGAEHTRVFVAEGSVTGSLLDLLSGAPSVTYIQAIEATRGLAVIYAELEAIAAEEPEVELLLRRSAEALYVRKARREHEMLALSAKERHAKWLSEHAGLDARVSRRHLASYLGVTPEHLSRLARAAGPRRSAPKAGARSRSR